MMTTSSDMRISFAEIMSVIDASYNSCKARHAIAKCSPSTDIAEVREAEVALIEIEHLKDAIVEIAFKRKNTNKYPKTQEADAG